MTFQIFWKTIWLSEFWVTGSRYKHLTLKILFLFQMLNKFQNHKLAWMWLYVSIFQKTIPILKISSRNSAIRIHTKIFVIICSRTTPTKIFLQLEHDIEPLPYLYNKYLGLRYVEEMPLVASNAHISLPQPCPLWKIINNSKSHIPTVLMIRLFKVLKSFFLFARLW